MKSIKFTIRRMLMVGFLLAAGLAVPFQAAGAISGATLTVNSNSDADNGSDTFCTLREAIIAANGDADYHECVNSGAAYGPDQILFSISGSTTITLTSNLPSIGGILTIDGSNSGTPVTIDGASAYQPFDVGSITTFTLMNITIQHGAASSGGAIINSGTLSIYNSTFLNNTAVSDGGAIVVWGGTTIIANSTFSGNSAAYGGGIAEDSGTLTLTNSTLSGNTATVWGGTFTTWNTVFTTINNTIMANSTPQDCYNGAGVNATLTGSNNIIETTGSGATSCSSITSSTSDPNLGTLTGSPAYFPIDSNSPAFDAGDDTICAAVPVNNTSQNGVARPQGFHCDIGAYEFPMSSLIIKSVGLNDGWILESSETSGVGGTMNSTATTFNLGDDSANKQYRAILHFDTSSVPATAVITSATLKIKKYRQIGSNPFTILGGLKVDMRKPAFGMTALALTDFKSAAGKGNVATFGATPLSNWYSAALSNAGNLYINRTGSTQFRLRFTTDDNNDFGDDYMRFYSGNAGAANQPQLVIQYYVP